MRIRITILPTGDRINDLRVAGGIRRALSEHAPVEVAPDNPLHGTHRDEQERAYFEFSTRDPDTINRVLRESGYNGQVEVCEARDALGQPCQNCGNVAGTFLPTICPNCHFRDVSPCPFCHTEVPRESYTRISGDVFRCPRCRNQVRMRFNEPMFLDDGVYNQPLVVVEQAEVHEVQV